MRRNFEIYLRKRDIVNS